MGNYWITIAGDSALNIEFSDRISPETSTTIRAAAQNLALDPIPGVVDLIPTFTALMVQYDPSIIRFPELVASLEHHLKNIGTVDLGTRVIIEIPVCYGSKYGPDIDTVAEHAGMTIDEVVELHSGRDYLIDMLGFMPGFAYLGGLDERLHTPRLERPRTRIEPGSVGIGGAQTGIYPLASPGGWQIIGRTPVRPYDPHRPKPILYSAGEYLRFVPISSQEYELIDELVQEGSYQCKTIVEDG